MSSCLPDRSPTLRNTGYRVLTCREVDPAERDEEPEVAVARGPAVTADRYG